MREVMEKDSDISPSLASASEAAEAPPTALVSAYGGEGHTQGQRSQALGHPGCQLPTASLQCLPWVMAEPLLAYRGISSREPASSRALAQLVRTGSGNAQF